MPSWGLVEVVVGKPRHGRVPTHVAGPSCDDWCAGPARRNGLVGCDLGWPSDPVWCMLNATAMTGVGCGSGLSCFVCGWHVRATAGTSHHVGAVKGPSMRPI